MTARFDTDHYYIARTAIPDIFVVIRKTKFYAAAVGGDSRGLLSPGEYHHADKPTPLSLSFSFLPLFSLLSSANTCGGVASSCNMFCKFMVSSWFI